MTKNEYARIKAIIRRRWSMEKGFVMSGQAVVMECPEEDVKALVDEHNAVIDMLKLLVDEQDGR